MDTCTIISKTLFEIGTYGHYPVFIALLTSRVVNGHVIFLLMKFR